MSKKVSFLLYSKDKNDIDCFQDEKYKDLACALVESGFNVETITWKKNNIDELVQRGSLSDALLIWINPLDRMVEEGHFEDFLRIMHAQNKYISNDPDIVLRIGTKKILHDLSGTKWISDTYYHEEETSLSSIATRIDKGNIRVLKQYRGNGGIGIYKIYKTTDGHYEIIETSSNDMKRSKSFVSIIGDIKEKISPENPIIEVPWNNHLINGMVRCYLCCGTVVGFGYQEINALYPFQLPTYVKKQRFYLTEKCGMFNNLKDLVENSFIFELIEKQKIDIDSLPLIWDVDFFINDIHTDKYELCEINASCVSPFPPSSIMYMCEEIKRRIT